MLVAGQTGVAMILLITAGLLINSYLKLSDNDLGADPEGVLTFQVRFGQTKRSRSPVSSTKASGFGT